MKPPSSDPLTMLEHINGLISQGGEILLHAVGSIQCAAVASDAGHCLAMLQCREGESCYQLLASLDAAIARAWDEGEFIDEINPES